MPFCRFFFGGGSPTKIEKRKGTLILTSLLEDLDVLKHFVLLALKGIYPYWKYALLSRGLKQTEVVVSSLFGLCLVIAPTFLSEPLAK